MISFLEIKIERNDFVEVKEKILNMSANERKRLGINKSTLWYQKNENNKNLFHFIINLRIFPFTFLVDELAVASSRWNN